MRYFSFLLVLAIIATSCSQQNEKSDKKSDSNDETRVEQTGAETQDNSDENDVATTDDSTELLTPEMESAPAPEEFEDMDWAEYEASLTKDFSFVIIISTKSYDAALKRAKEASEKLGYPLDLRGLHANDEIGLSFSKQVCEDEICGGGLDYPIYIPRSDWGEEKYISVEYSDAFDGFTKGYYIVVVASGEKGAPIVKEALKEAKKHYKDAYAKTCGVYMGCGC